MKNILVFTLFLSACGKASDVYVIQDSQMQQNQSQCTDVTMHGTVRYKYNYSTESCTTNCHSAQSKQDYCAQLQDDKLNNDCAKDERKRALEEAKCI